jgi:hypothetical protein
MGAFMRWVLLLGALVGMFDKVTSGRVGGLSRASHAPAFAASASL